MTLCISAVYPRLTRLAYLQAEAERERFVQSWWGRVLAKLPLSRHRLLGNGETPSYRIRNAVRVAFERLLKQAALEKEKIEVLRYHEGGLWRRGGVMTLYGAERILEGATAIRIRPVDLADYDARVAPL